MTTLNNRYDFMFVFDVKNGNPNGDPSEDNRPRFNEMTGKGFVSDACIKRKIRNYVDSVMEGTPNYGIRYKKGVELQKSEKEILEQHKLKKGYDWVEAKKQICEEYFDTRTFGDVLTSFTKNGGDGQLTGPVQVSFSESVDPIDIEAFQGTRLCVCQEKAESGKEKVQDFSFKYFVPYALYVGKGTISAQVAKKTGFSEEDVKVLWDAIQRMFMNDESASHGEMYLRKLIIFKHSSAWGDVQSYVLHNAVSIKKKADKRMAEETPTCFEDYEVSIDYDNIPSTISVEVRE